MANIDASGICQSQSEAFGHLIQLVKLVTMEVLSSTLVRVTFDRPMKNDAALVSKYNYQIIPSTPGAVTPYVSSVEPENAISPTFVDLIISEMTDGASYDGHVNTTGPVDLEGTFVDPAHDSYGITGVGVAPTIERVEAIGENRVDVIFSEVMEDNDDIRNSTKYSFDNGLSVIDVLEVDGATVKLVTSDQVDGLLYNLTVNP